MKLVGYRENGQDRLGLLVGTAEMVDLQALDAAAPTDLGAYLRDGGDLAALRELAQRAESSAARRQLAGLEHGLPVATPGKIFCLGLNYLGHVREGPFQVPDYPSVFMRGLSSLVPHRQPILRPLISDALDYEAELVAVIGKRVRHAGRANALAAVAGYACFNDGTLRDYQKRTTQWTIGKNFDRTGGFGPFFVSADVLPPGAAGLRIESRLNGRVMQSDNTSNMMFAVAETIALLTQAITLEPGDLLVMGTPSGVGYARKPPVFMVASDIVEIEIEGIGTLANPVESEMSTAHDKAAA